MLTNRISRDFAEALGRGRPLDMDARDADFKMRDFP